VTAFQNDSSINSEQPWWQRSRSDPVVAHLRYAGDAAKQGLPLQLSMLQQLGPFELLLDFLPKQLAGQLLTTLLQVGISCQHAVQQQYRHTASSTSVEVPVLVYAALWY
jgi:hypothetical protein